MRLLCGRYGRLKNLRLKLSSFLDKEIVENNSLLIIIFVPLLGSLVLPFMGKVSEKLRNILAFLMVFVSLVTALSLVPKIYSGKIITLAYNLPYNFNFTLLADGYALFTAIASSLISSIIVLYSFGYISHYENRNEYYMMVVMFFGSMMGIVFSSNLIYLYLFWELTAITSWRLIGFFRNENDVIKADKSFLVTAGGALLMLVGFLMLYSQTGSFDLGQIKNVLRTKTVSDIAVLLILVGIFSKSATLPFHTWLPDAGVAPSPVTALLHAAVLVKIGVYVFGRLFVATFTPSQIWHTVVPLVAGISALVSAGAALRETDIKRIIAYSTISQIGFIFLGFGISNKIAVAGAMLYILMHGMAKAGLFLCAGIIEQNTHTKDITKMGGLMKAMPVTGVAFLLCSFSVMGIPPLGGFFCKYMVMAGTLMSGHLAIAGIFLVGAVFTILYLFRTFNYVFMGELKFPNIKEGSAGMVFCVGLLAVLSVVGGILIWWPNVFLQNTIAQMVGVIK